MMSPWPFSGQAIKPSNTVKTGSLRVYIMNSKIKNVGVFGLKTSSNLVSMGHQHFCLQSINADLNSRLGCDYISDSFDLGVV